MKRFNFLLVFCLMLCFACQSSSESSNTDNSVENADTEIVESKPENPDSASQMTTNNNDEAYVTTTYRSDGFRPGVASEWVAIKSDPEAFKIIEILYWSTADEDKIPLKIVKQEFSEGEISGYTGEVMFPNDTETVGFGIIEDRFNLSYSEDMFQEFLYEEK
ncbi:MAG: hypothetical protein JJT94_10260 [Bernardetiaceae bacterium]|nr:hypothetical protein [Bernardetiaceae bacterium]